LHARLRVIFREEGDRELHFCFRVLQATNAISFLARARAAITEAGIDLRLPFRNLTFLRNEKLPAGNKCQDRVNHLKERGSHVSEVSQSELATVLALSELERRKDSDFDRWIRQRRPLSVLPLVRQVFAEYLDICNRGVEHHESDVPQLGSEV